MSTSPVSERVEVTTELLASIEHAANAAAPALWHACIGSGAGEPGESCKCRMVYGGEGPPVAFAIAAEDESFTCGEGWSKEQARANARYIAAASPAVVLALVEHIRELEAREKKLQFSLRT